MRRLVGLVTVVLAAACAVAVLATRAHSPERVAAALLLIFILPGLPASLLLRPVVSESERLGRSFSPLVERLFLVPALSIAIVILDSAGLYVFGVRLDLHAWTLSLAVIAVVLSVVEQLGFARIRRAEREPQLTLERRGFRLSAAGVTPGLAIAAATLLGAGMLAGAGALTYASVSNRTRADRFTQLWLLPSGASSRSATLGVFNHEGRTQTYALKVSADGRQIRSQQLNVASGATWLSSQSYSPQTATLSAQLVDSDGSTESTVLHLLQGGSRSRTSRATR